MELVIIPTWRRPDFLHAALTCVVNAAKNYSHDRLQFWVCVDRHYAADVTNVARGFQRTLGPRMRIIVRTPHRYHGNSFNVLSAYNSALDIGASRIHLVEEDVFVARDYFEFHRRAHELKPDTFAVSACRNQNMRDDPPDDPTAIYTHHTYQSLGVSFHPDQLRHVQPHMKAAYYGNPVGYCRNNFPETRIHPDAAEQDGLIHRVIEAREAQVVYPAIPRAYHAGFHGYNRKGLALRGRIEQRSQTLLNMTAAELNARAESYPDHRTTPLHGDRPPITNVIKWPVAV